VGQYVHNAYFPDGTPYRALTEETALL
jgi:hypothetical protein